MDKKMENGDLVKKVKGYGSNANEPLIGVVVGTEYLGRTERVIVLTEGDVESWIKKFVKVICKNKI